MKRNIPKETKLVLFRLCISRKSQIHLQIMSVWQDRVTRQGGSLPSLGRGRLTHADILIPLVSLSCGNLKRQQMKLNPFSCISNHYFCSSPTPVKKAIQTKWCLDESDLVPEDDPDPASLEETEKSGGSEEKTELLTVAINDLEEDVALEDSNVFKRDVKIRERRQKYQTNFI